VCRTDLESLLGPTPPRVAPVTPFPIQAGADSSFSPVFLVETRTHSVRIGGLPFLSCVLVFISPVVGSRPNRLRCCADWVPPPTPGCERQFPLFPSFPFPVFTFLFSALPTAFFFSELYCVTAVMRPHVWWPPPKRFFFDVVNAPAGRCQPLVSFDYDFAPGDSFHFFSLFSVRCL